MSGQEMEQQNCWSGDPGEIQHRTDQTHPVLQNAHLLPTARARSCLHLCPIHRTTGFSACLQPQPRWKQERAEDKSATRLLLTDPTPRTPALAQTAQSFPSSLTYTEKCQRFSAWSRKTLTLNVLLLDVNRAPKHFTMSILTKLSTCSNSKNERQK